MKAYSISNESWLAVEERLKQLDSYKVGDLLYVLRMIEESPRDYDEQIIKRVFGRLAEKNIICM